MFGFGALSELSISEIPVSGAPPASPVQSGQYSVLLAAFLALPFQPAIAPQSTNLCLLARPATVALPLPAYERNFPAQVHVLPGLFPNPDTSRGSPKTLLPADPRQRFLALQLPPLSQPGLTPNPDTSRGTPETLRPEINPPRGNVAPFQQQTQTTRDQWLPADTTQDMPSTLRQPPSPFVPAPHYPPPRFWFQPADTTQDTPETLRPESTVPAGTTAPQFAPVAKPANNWLPADTSQGQPEMDRQPPLVVAPTFSPQATPYLPADSSRGTPAPLQQPPTPVIPAPHLAPTLYPSLPADGSRGTPETLRPEAATPSGINSPEFVPLQHPVNEWLPADTSQGLGAALRPFPLPTGTNAPFFAPVRYWFQPADSSAGTPEGLRPEIKLPIGEDAAPFFQVQHPNLEWLSPDTSRGLPSTLRSPPAPFVPPAHFAPVFYPGLPADTSRGIPKALQPEVRPPAGQQSLIVPLWQPQPVVNTSAGLNAGTIPLALPPGKQVYIAPAQVAPQPQETSRSSYGTFYPFIQQANPPGQAAFVALPQWPGQVVDTTAPQAEALIRPPGPPIPPTPPAVTYGGVWVYGLTHWKRLRGELTDADDYQITPETMLAVGRVVERIPEPTTADDAAAKILLRLEMERQRKEWDAAYLDVLEAYRAGYRDYMADLEVKTRAKREAAEQEERQRKAKRRRHLIYLLLDQ